MDWRITTAMFSGLTTVYVVLICYYHWFSTHISDSVIHPHSDTVVYKDVCEGVQKFFIAENKHHVDCLEAQEQRTEKSFDELKKSMDAGFAELKKLIRESGK